MNHTKTYKPKTALRLKKEGLNSLIGPANIFLHRNIKINLPSVFKLGAYFG